MIDDIADRLRLEAKYQEAASLDGPDDDFCQLLRSAADEIDRLWELVQWEAGDAFLVIDQQKAEIERLRGLGDTLLEAARDIRDCRGRGAGTIQRAFEAWEEARRD